MKLKDIKILIVDNEIDTDTRWLKKLIDYLEDKYTVISKRKYIEEARQDFKYDIYSIDLLLVDIDFGASGRGAGLQFLKEIRETDKDIPVGVITQHDSIPYAFRAGKNMATFFLLKKELLKKDGNLDTEKIDNTILDAITRFSPLYNRKLMRIVNSHLALTYDIEENSKQGTLAFCHWESEKILETINSKYPGSKLKILDIGCGTGRYELLLKKYCQKEFDMVAMDFAGRMLLEAKEKFEANGIYPETANQKTTNIKLKRASAERLPFPDNEFDVIICGFGIPSYTKFNLSMPEANRVLRTGGKAIFTVYNKNAIFNKIADYFFPTSKDKCPMASWVKFYAFPGTSKECEKQEGIFKLVPQGKEADAFEIQPFTIEEFRDILNRFSFKIEEIMTFPILYAITPTDLINRPTNDLDFKPKCVNDYTFPEYNDEIKKRFGRKFKEICEKEGLSEAEIRMNVNKKLSELEEAYRNGHEQNKNFSWRFYQLDKEYAEKLGDGGSYITTVVRKVKDAERVNKYERE